MKRWLRWWRQRAVVYPLWMGRAPFVTGALKEV